MPSKPLLIFPGCTNLPRDPDGDGRYEDINGDGVVNRTDVEILSNNLDWAAANQPIECFDYNANGRIDFADIVWLNGIGTPIASFSLSPDPSGGATATFEVQCTDTSAKNPTSRTWTLIGEWGSIAAWHNPQKFYLGAGTWTIRLTVSNAYGSSSTERAFYVSPAPPAPPPPAPVANFSGTPLSGMAPLTVAFTDGSSNSPTAWSWSFGDGGSSSSQSPSHTYTVPGTYTVTLTASNAGGSDAETKNSYITVTNPPEPIASFSATPVAGMIPLVVQFTDTSANAPTSWAWDFGDDGTSTAQHPTHTYEAIGTYTVSLVATNGSGSSTKTRTNLIIAAPHTEAPNAAFGASLRRGEFPLTVSFFDQSTWSPTSWLWQFGDGATSSDRMPVHTYTVPGAYTVTLTVQNATGSDTEQQVGFVVVEHPPATPVPALTAAFQTGYAPFAVQFTDSSANAPTSWLWDFGDGETSRAQHPAHTYTRPGLYTVTLTAGNRAGSASVSLEAFVQVRDPIGLIGYRGEFGGYGFGVDAEGGAIPVEDTTPAPTAPGSAGYSIIAPPPYAPPVTQVSAYGRTPYSLPITERQYAFPVDYQGDGRQVTIVDGGIGYGTSGYGIGTGLATRGLQYIVRIAGPIRRCTAVLTAGGSVSTTPAPGIQTIAFEPPQHLVIWVLNQHLHTIGVVDAFDRLVWTRKWRRPHAFELTIPRDVNGAEVFRKPPNLAGEDVARYIGVTINGTMRIGKIEVGGFETSNEGPSSKVFTIRGRSLACLFDDRIALHGTTTGTGYDVVRDFNACEVMRYYVANNVTDPPNDTGRQIDLVGMGYSISGTRMFDEYSARFETISDLLEQISIDSDVVTGSDEVNPGGVGYDVVWRPASHRFRFDVLKANRAEPSRLHQFSLTRDNLKRLAYEGNVADLKTVAIVAADGEGAERNVWTVAAGDGVIPTGLDRREMFVDARDIATDEEGGLDKIQPRGRQHLAEHAGVLAIEFDILNNGSSRYFNDFDLGDLVRVDVEGLFSTVTRILEVQEDYTHTGLDISVVCGRSIPDLASAVRSDISHIRQTGRG